MFFDVPVKNKKEASEKMSRLVKIVITQLAIYLTMNIFQTTAN